MSTLSIMTLNVWGGRLLPELEVFLSKRQQDLGIDVFCFQEVFSSPGRERELDPKGFYPELFRAMERLLPSYMGLFIPSVNDLSFDHWVDYPMAYGLAFFIRRSLPIISLRSELVHSHPLLFDPSAPGTTPRTLGMLVTEVDGVRIGIANLHGLWNAKGKTDCPERISQSNTTIHLLGPPFPERHILCGDFNLLPTTESFAILTRGRRDLVSENGVLNTRSSHYLKAERYADYILLAGDVSPVEFEVCKDEVSDHLPLRAVIALH